MVWKWELFDWWCEGIRQLGYHLQPVSVSSAYIGGENNPHTPQWRDRLYLVFTRHGIPLPDVAPASPHTHRLLMRHCHWTTQRYRAG